MAQVNTKAFALLVQMGQEAKPELKAVQLHKDKLQGAYNHGVKAAIECGSVDTFKATIEKLESDIRHNRDGLAVKFGAPKRERPSEKGEKYTIPGSVSNVKSTLIFALEHKVELAFKNPKNGQVESHTFGQIRKFNAAIRAKLEADKGNTLTGVELERWKLEQACVAMRAKIGDMTEQELAANLKAMADYVPEVTTGTGEQLAPAAEVAPAPQAKRTRRSGGTKPQASEQRQAA